MSSAMTRLGAAVRATIVCAAVLSPIVQGFREKPRDDFPLSWFPMFAKARPELEKPVYAVAIGAGEEAYVASRYWTSGGFNQGASQLIRAASAGSQKLRPLCERIAKGVAKRAPRGVTAPTEVQIRRGTYSLVTFFGDGDRKPIRESVLVSCPVTKP
jgi:hypothetical protein